MDRIQAVAAMTILVCEQGFTELDAREILAATAEGYDILCLTQAEHLPHPPLSACPQSPSFRA